MRKLLVLFLCILMSGWIVGVKAIPEGSKAPDFMVETYSGEYVCLAEFEDKVVILGFFQYECPHCKKDLPIISEDLKKCDPNSYVVILDGVGGNADLDYRLFKKYALGDNWYFVPENFNLVKLYDVKFTPTWVIIYHGIVKRFIVGETKQDFCELVSSILAANKKPTTINGKITIENGELRASGVVISDGVPLAERNLSIVIRRDGEKVSSYEVSTDKGGVFEFVENITWMGPGNYSVEISFKGDREHKPAHLVKKFELKREVKRVKENLSREELLSFFSKEREKLRVLLGLKHPASKVALVLALENQTVKLEISRLEDIAEKGYSLISEGNVSGAEKLKEEYLHLRDAIVRSLIRAGNISGHMTFNFTFGIKKGEVKNISFKVLGPYAKKIEIKIAQTPSPQILWVFGSPVYFLEARWDKEVKVNLSTWLSNISYSEICGPFNGTVNLSIRADNLGVMRWILIFPIEMSEATLHVKIVVCYSDVPARALADYLSKA